MALVLMSDCSYVYRCKVIAITLYIQGMDMGEGEDMEEGENTTVAISGCDAATFLTVYSDDRARTYHISFQDSPREIPWFCSERPSNTGPSRMPRDSRQPTAHLIGPV